MSLYQMEALIKSWQPIESSNNNDNKEKVQEGEKGNVKVTRKRNIIKQIISD